MKFNGNDINKPKVFDSKDLSEDTQKIRLDKIQERLMQEEDYYEEFRTYEENLSEHKRKLKKIFLWIVIVVLILILSVTLIAVMRISKLSRLENNAQKYMKEQELSKAADIYKELYDETDNPIFMQNYRSIMKDIENKDLIKDAKMNIQNEDYEGAIELLMTIKTADEAEAEQIVEMINLSAKKWIKYIEDIYKDGKYDRCDHEINKFINLLPENIGGMDFINKLSNKNSRSSVKLKSVLAKDRKSLDDVSIKVRSKLFERAKSIINTRQIVGVDEASVREKPNKDSRIDTTLHRGENIYVVGTVSEGGKNVWCKVSFIGENKKPHTGWISYNMIKGIEDSGN